VIATPTDWVLSVAEYSIFIRPDLLQQFWQVMSDGGFITEAVAVIDTSRRTGRRVLVEAAAAWPRAEGTLPVVRRAGGDRVGSRGWGVDALDRGSTGAQRVDDLARA